MGQNMDQNVNQKYNTEETVMYCIGWCCIAALALFVVLYQQRPERFTGLSACIFWRMTGFYCPGCGGTRAVLALMQGRLLRALIYHPFVPYSFLIGGWFMVSQTIQRLSGRRISIGMKYRDIYLWLALGIVIAGCILKNSLLLWGIDLLEGAAFMRT